eukprot:TRINITY_DN33420_c0_g1_i1.p1 TRINITY_DN33420_c0_g1~~TRINITY_DN33420_c0_g1_i1.p1  ORF type:complete len:1108 (-),score=289.40 TRINITY_DN33420_c0_g1_i1:30-3353(-)
MGWQLASSGNGGEPSRIIEPSWVHDLGRRAGSLGPASALTTAAAGITGASSSFQRGSSQVGFGGRPWSSPTADYSRKFCEFGFCPSHSERAAAGDGKLGSEHPKLHGLDDSRFRCTFFSAAATAEGRRQKQLLRAASSPLLAVAAGNSAGTGTGAASGFGRLSSKGKLSSSLTRRKGPAVTGWLPVSQESAEVSELAQSVRVLFAAYDTSGDGRIDLAEFVEAQAHLFDALGVKSDEQAARRQFYEIENARLRGSVAFGEFFRAQLARLEAEQAQAAEATAAGALSAEWPKRVLWSARQIALGRQRQQLRAWGLEISKLAADARRLAGTDSSESAFLRAERIRELQNQRQRETQGRLLVRGTVVEHCVEGAGRRLEGAAVELAVVLPKHSASTDTAASRIRTNAQGSFEHRIDAHFGQVLTLVATADGCAPTCQVVGGEGLRQVCLELAPFTAKGKLRAEAGREGFKTIRDSISGASFDVPVGDLQKEGRPFDGDVSFGASVVDMSSKAAVDAMPTLLGRCANGNISPLHAVAAVYLELRDPVDGRALQLRSGSSGLEVSLPTRVVMPMLKPSLWHHDVPKGLWDESQVPVAMDGFEIPMPLLGEDEELQEEDQASVLLSKSTHAWAGSFSSSPAGVEAEINLAFGMPGRRLKGSSFYSSSEARRALPALQELADWLVQGMQISDAATGCLFQEVDVRGKNLLALEHLIGLWASPPGADLASLHEMRQALARFSGDVAEAFLAVATAQARRFEATRIRQALRAKDSFKVACYHQVEAALESSDGQERAAIDYLSSDWDIYYQAELERIRAAVGELLPSACPSTYELGAAQAAARSKARAIAKEAEQAEVAAAEQEETLRSLNEQLEEAKADKKRKEDAERLTQEVADAEARVEELRRKAQAAKDAAAEAASPAKAAEVLAEDPLQQERASDREGIRRPSKQQRRHKEERHTINFKVSKTGRWDCIAAPQAVPMQEKVNSVSQQDCSLVLGILEDAATAVSITACDLRCRAADKCLDVAPDGCFSLLVLAGTEFEIKVFHDDFETEDTYGPFTAESPGHALCVGVLGAEAATPSRAEITMPVITGRQGSRRASKTSACQGRGASKAIS